MDGILNAFNRSMQKPYYAKSFDEKVQTLLAYPRTKNIDRKDFQTTSCYYSCNEEKECDFKQCIEKIKETDFKNPELNTFMKKITDEKFKCLTPEVICDGYLFQYTEDNNSSKSIFHMVNEKQKDTRTGFIELNEKRLEIINQ
jgi:hypothetical protein